MDESAPTRPRKGPFHKALLALWFMICAWLVGSLLSGVITSLFMGDGPINYPPANEKVSPAPEPSKGP